MTAILQYAEQAAAIRQVSTELYRMPLEDANVRKWAAFRHYTRSGRDVDSQASLLVLTPEQLAAAVNADMTVSAIRSTMIEAHDELGGFLVPEDYRTGIIGRIAASSVVRPRATVYPTLTDRLIVPKAAGGDSRYTGAARVSWVGETGIPTGTTTEATFASVRVPVYLGMVSIDAGRTLVEDASSPLLDHLAALLSDAYAIDEDAQALVGSGSEGLRGVLVNGTPVQGVAAPTSGAAAALTADGLSDAPFSIAPQYRRRPGAAWVTSTTTVKTMLKLKDGDGRPLLSFEGADRRNGAPLLGGYVVEEVSDDLGLPTIGAGLYPILYADWSGYAIADRLGMSLEMFDDSTTARTNSVRFVARRRVGGQVTQPERFLALQIAA